eukprot:scaffold3926_cov124-Isochrysis_galbana.AAC.4
MADNGQTAAAMMCDDVRLRDAHTCLLRLQLLARASPSLRAAATRGRATRGARETRQPYVVPNEQRTRSTRSCGAHTRPRASYALCAPNRR